MGWISWILFCCLKFILFLIILQEAYSIRLLSVQQFGMVIHEFDPWFNFRATKYLVDNGYSNFTNWFDTEVWYPLGRHVGTTVYPGMMVTAAAIYRALPHLGITMSLNDVCVLIPAWFSCAACFFTFLLSYEVSRSVNAALMGTALMAILPAHLMRSIAGEYDNECIAVAIICSTFYFWVRSLRSSWSWPIGLLAGLSYVYMVATWGGYVFVLNLIALHAFILVLSGRFSAQLHLSYSLFYIVGTLGAIQFPIVGLQPIKSLEQLAGLFVFIGLQVTKFLYEYQARRKLPRQELIKFCLKVVGLCMGVGLFVLLFILPSGWVGPLSARVRSLFVPHTRTGNPLVDSVAEHQATSDRAYFQNFNLVYLLWFPGFYLCARNRNEGTWFMILYFLVAAYFSRKMTRLILILAQPAAILAGMTYSAALAWMVDTTWSVVHPEEMEKAARAPEEKKKRKKASSGDLTDIIKEWYEFGIRSYRENTTLRAFIVGSCALTTCTASFAFWRHCWHMAAAMSSPQIMLTGRTNTGEMVIIDDFREAYWWLRDNTRKDSRVLSWWDYGYQINGIAERTTLADGNTWNHEHIALLGRVLVSSERESWEIARHLADYVLVWTTRYAGMGGDDIAKSPHMARIGSSVYEHIDFRNFWHNPRTGETTPLMKQSLLWRLHHHRLDPSEPPLTLYKEVHTTTHKMVRIYKIQNRSRESKEFCRQALEWAREHGGGGRYPPALDWLMEERKDFSRQKEGKYML